MFILVPYVNVSGNSDNKPLKQKMGVSSVYKALCRKRFLNRDYNLKHNRNYSLIYYDSAIKKVINSINTQDYTESH